MHDKLMVSFGAILLLAVVGAGCANGIDTPKSTRDLSCVYVPEGSNKRFREYFERQNKDINNDNDGFMRFTNTYETRQALMKYAKILMTERAIFSDNIAQIHVPGFVPKQVIIQDDGKYQIVNRNTPVNLDNLDVYFYELKSAVEDYYLCLNILEKFDPSIVYIHRKEIGEPVPAHEKVRTGETNTSRE